LRCGRGDGGGGAPGRRGASAFASHLGDLDLGSRDEAPDDHLGVSTLVTTVAPDALGLSSSGPDAEYFGMRNQVEGISFVG
jgi:hypothetical protein